MYYIPAFIETANGININGAKLVTEEGNEVLTFKHLTLKGYASKKPLIIDFAYNINSDCEIEVSDEIAMELIERFKGITPKIFETPAMRSRAHIMTGMLALASYMGDHGDTSGQFSR